MSETIEIVSFDCWLKECIKSWHPEYDDRRIQCHINSVYEASQNFPDENGGMADAQKTQVLNCLKIWRSYDYHQ